MDLVGHIDDPVVAEALVALRHRTEDLRYLGSWPVADGEEAGSPPPDHDDEKAWLEGLRRGDDV